MTPEEEAFATAVLAAFRELLAVEAINGKQALLSQHPELLSDGADDLLGIIISQTRDREVLRNLVAHRKMIQRCRKVGIKEAFAEMSAASSGYLELTRALMRAHDLQRDNELLGKTYRKLRFLADIWQQVESHREFPFLGDNIRSHILDSIIVCYWECYSNSGSLDDLAATTRYCTEQVEITPEETPDYPFYLSRLGSSLGLRYAHTGDVAALEECVELQRNAAGLPMEDVETEAIVLNNLGSSLGKLYEHSDELEHLEELIAAWDAAASLRFRRLAMFPVIQMNRGMAYKDRYDRLRDSEDLDISVRELSQAVKGLRNSRIHQGALHYSLHSLGNSLVAKYEETRDPAYLRKALAAWDESIKLTPPMSAELPLRLSSSAGGFREHYRLSGNESDLIRAIDLWRKCIELSHEGSPFMSTYRSNLSMALSDRYTATGDTIALAEAVSLQQTVVKSLTSRSQNAAQHARRLSELLKDQYLQHGVEADLEEAIKLARQAIYLMPENSHELLAGARADLGKRLRERFERSGEEKDLEEAIELLSNAASYVPVDGDYGTGVLTSLAQALLRRYMSTRDGRDLTKAISTHEAAVSRNGHTSIDLASFGQSLGVYYDYLMTRERDSAQSTLDHAIDLLRKAINEAHGQPILLPVFHADLAELLTKRYYATHAIADLRDAVESDRQALARSPKDSPHAAGHLLNLGIRLRIEYQATGIIRALNEAIEVHKRAISHSEPEEPAFSLLAGALGEDYWAMYAKSGDVADLSTCIDWWERSWSSYQQNVVSSVAYRFGQEDTWSRFTAGLITAYLRYGEISPDSFEASARRAMILAESRKSQLITAATSRDDLIPPASVPADMCQRERELISRIKAIDNWHLAAYQDDREAGALYPSRMQERQVLVRQLTALWDEIKDLGRAAADYVKARNGTSITWEKLSATAHSLGSETMLMSLYIQQDQTVLFVLRPGWTAPIVIRVDISSADWINGVYRRFFREVPRRGSDYRRTETWHRPLMPLLCEAENHLRDTTLVIFAPDGIGLILPWAVAAAHAKWCDPQGSPMPLVTLPTLTLLGRLEEPLASQTGNALVVGNPIGSEDESTLPYAEDEALAVAKLLGATALVGGKATKAAALERWKESPIVHLATHAFLDEDSPLDSGIHFADDILTAREVIALNLSSQLLVLSACNTGTARTLGESRELISLVHAFLLAGTSSVVASLWPINDQAASMLAIAFYRSFIEGNTKARALRDAMASVQSVAKWRHPYYWGAFLLVGDWR